MVVVEVVVVWVEGVVVGVEVGGGGGSGGVKIKSRW